jgi:capsular polysaccharide export protein
VKTCEPPTRRLALLSYGLFRIRKDIETLTASETSWSPTGLMKANGYVGWGLRGSGQLARTRSLKTGADLVILEDGFLKGFSASFNEPPQSYIVDKSGIYFDTNGKSDFNFIISQQPSRIELDRAKGLIKTLRENHITKFNDAQLLSLKAAELPTRKPYFLLVDQVPHDASIKFAGASSQTFKEMLLYAQASSTGHNLIVRSHPAAGRHSPLVQAAKECGIPIIISPKMNPWPLIEDADAVFTVSSQLGFEALMAEKPVHCFGRSYYSEMGQTVDHFDQPTKTEKNIKSIAELFHAAYCQYAVYLDLHNRQQCSIETAIDQAICVRNQRNRLGKKIYAVRFSPWKRLATNAVLTASCGKPKHFIFASSAKIAAAKNAGHLAIWGAGMEESQDNCLHVEDGYVRSRGLGAAYVYPCSLTVDSFRPHYDGRGASDLENLLETKVFDAPILARASALRKQLTISRVTKYNVGDVPTFPDNSSNRLRILVPGQVATDQSIRLGTNSVRTNWELVAQVRKLYPGAFIIFKVHPDVAAGHRTGGDSPIHQDLTVSSGSITHWLDWADRIETMTSLVGFEALIREKQVGVHGVPFYAGWGLTVDHEKIPRRIRKLTINELIAGALIYYPLYVHPKSRMPCSVERLIEYLAE